MRFSKKDIAWMCVDQFRHWYIPAVLYAVIGVAMYLLANTKLT